MPDSVAGGLLIDVMPRGAMETDVLPAVALPTGVLRAAELGAIAMGALLLLVLASVVLRRRTLLRRGAVECGYRSVSGSAQRWRLGLLSVGPGELRWHRLLSPYRWRRVLPRSGSEVVGQRPLRAGEERLFGAGARVLQLRVAREDVELAVSPDGVPGLLAWWEASPPGAPPPSGRALKPRRPGPRARRRRGS